MRKPFFLILAVALSSCSVFQSSVQRSPDPFKNVISYRLEQNLQAYEGDNKNFFGVYPKHSMVGVNYYGQVMPNNQKTIFLEFIINRPFETHLPDSTLYLQVDKDIYTVSLYNQVIREYTKTHSIETKGSGDGGDDTNHRTSSYTTYDEAIYEIITSSFEFPMQIAEAIGNSSKLTYRVYVGNRPLDIKPKSNERRKIKKFFRKTLSERF